MNLTVPVTKESLHTIGVIKLLQDMIKNTMIFNSQNLKKIELKVYLTVFFLFNVKYLYFVHEIDCPCYKKSLHTIKNKIHILKNEVPQKKKKKKIATHSLGKGHRLRTGPVLGKHEVSALR